MILACASTPEAESSAEQTEALSAKDYYPLAIGNKWTYRGEPHPEDVHIEIVKVDDGFFIDNNEPPSRLQPRSSGIFDGDRFLLEDPLEVGHTWMAVPSVAAVERYEIVATDLRVQTPAGSFSNCVRVKAEVPGRTPAGDKMKLIMNWTYAPRVGLVRLEQKVQLGDQPPRVGMWMELVAYEVPAP